MVRTLGSKKDWLGRTRPVAEIRQYAPVLVAEVSLTGMEMRDALSSGFRQIAGFIFGGNTAPGSQESSKVAMTSPVTLEAAGPSSQKIAMTAPVTAEAVDTDTFKVSFIMPSKYTPDSLPVPKNENVKIREVPSRTMAALAWRGGSPSSAVMDSKAAQLRAVLKAAGMSPIGPVHLWQYHPPFAPAWMRRNEVLYETNTGVVAS